MASFTTRLELVNADPGDYTLLHQEMRDRQFYIAIQSCGVWYDLPTGVYNRDSTAQLGIVYDDAAAAAQVVINNKPNNNNQQPKSYLLLVTNDSDMAIVLPKTTDISHLPPGASL
ncbi:MAG TPA: hypothetical protein VHS53_12645 [Mucilaginibacter sp.]|jgi:hypothetical protein|nr:hypothetical protein [Mucilaginibacter sp.]